MRKIALFSLLALAALACPALAQTKAPGELAGLTLGRPLAEFAERLDVDKAVPLWDKPYLTRMNVKPTKGFRAGYVLFGNCVDPGRLVRIKFKYKDDTEAFFNDKLAVLTKRFGKPESLSESDAGYRGYRWSFGKDKKSAVSLSLERYLGQSADVTDGNSIRLTDQGLLTAERTCYDAKRDKEPEPQPAFPLFTVDDEWLLPH